MKFLVTCVIILAVLIERSVGSIVVAASCSKGIVIGSDTLEASGGLVGTRFCKRIFSFNPYVTLCCAGNKRDFVRLCEDVKDLVYAHEEITRHSMGVTSIAQLVRNRVSTSFPSAHVLVVGSDKKEDAVPTNSDVQSVPCSDDESSSSSISSQTNSPVSSSTVKDPIFHVTNSVGQPWTSHRRFGVYEVLPGGTLLSLTHAVAGTSSSLIWPLFQDLFPVPVPVPPHIAQQHHSPSARHPSDSLENEYDELNDVIRKVHQVVLASVDLDPQSGGRPDLWIFTSGGLHHLNPQ